jgi:hypothetical protein
LNPQDGAVQTRAAYGNLERRAADGVTNLVRYAVASPAFGNAMNRVGVTQ